MLAVFYAAEACRRSEPAQESRQVLRFTAMRPGFIPEDVSSQKGEAGGRNAPVTGSAR